MIDHISIAVRDLDRAARFYQAVLGAVGYEKLVVRAAHRRLRQGLSRILAQPARDHGTD
jgi:catechol 2,3-dioxygenase-like lactoylglutathione lyase family enzyme